MAEIRVDFTDVKDGGFEPLPEGDYDATVFEIEPKVGKTSGKPYLNWQFKIQGGDYDGRRAFLMTSLSPAALWGLKRNLKALGFTDEELAGNLDLDTSSIIGQECTIRIKHEEYEGKVSDKVDFIVAPEETSVAATGDAPLYR